LDFFQWFIEKAQDFMAMLLVNSFYAAILAAMIFLIKIIYPKLSSGLEYSLWCVVLIRLVLPVNFSIDYSLGYFSHHWFATELPILFAQSPLLGDWIQQPIFDQSEFSWMGLLISIWLISALLISSKYLSLKIKLSKLLAKAHPIEDPWLDKKINFWRREFNILRPIILIDSDDFLSPFTFGILSPVIYIPSELLKEKDKNILAPIMAHELAHIKRFDAAWLVFQNLVQIIYCFNPIVWLAVRRLNSLREEICDKKVLDQKAINPNQYGESLLKVLRLNIGQKSPEHFAAFFLSHKQIFKNRIAKICDLNLPSSSYKLHFALVSSFAFFLLPMGYPLVSQEIVAPAKYPVAKTPVSPFPDEVKKDFQAPVLIHANKDNKDEDQVEIDG